MPSRFRVIGYEPARQVPLASAADLLRTLTKLGPAERQLGILMLDSGEERSSLEPVQVFEAAHRVVRPFDSVLVLVDDLQWVDDLSLALIHYLVRAAEADGPPLALIAAGRPSANAVSFAASLGQVLPAERLVEIGSRRWRTKKRSSS